MKKSFTGALTIVFLLIMTLSLFAPAASAVSDTWTAGDTGYMGRYPQTRVTDTDLLAKLNTQTLSWVSFDYYSGQGYAVDSGDPNYGYGTMVSGDWMKYADVTVDGTEYRAVTFSQYRPVMTGYQEDLNRQDDNGYEKTDTTYWFRYDPIEWQVLDPSSGLVMSRMLLDAQCYCNTIYQSGSEYYSDAACTIFSNDYVTSYIRKWLNDDFFNTAFSSAEQAAVKTTPLDNSACTTDDSQFNSAATNDRIFLLSYAQAQDASLGFEGTASASAARCADSTDYAQCQGIMVDSGSGQSIWLLRSPGIGSRTVGYVDTDGSLSDAELTNYTAVGVRPAMEIDLAGSVFTAAAQGQGTTAQAGELSSASSAAVTSSASTKSVSRLWVLIPVILIIAAVITAVIIVKNKKKAAAPGVPRG